MHGEVRVVDDVSRAFAELVAEEAPSSLALSGGGTARSAYEALARTPVSWAWSAVDVYFGDERWVPVDDPESNERLARDALLDAVGPGSVHSMRGTAASPEAGADEYDALLRSNGPLGLVHLGLGPDGHTASLFPGSPALAVRDRLVVATGDDLHPHPRITVTYPALEQAGLVVFTVAGADKHDAFARVAAGDDLPAGRVAAARLIWLVDPGAAGG
jgi:6-phosphogluconolactonase